MTPIDRDGETLAQSPSGPGFAGYGIQVPFDPATGLTWSLVDSRPPRMLFAHNLACDLVFLVAVHRIPRMQSFDSFVLQPGTGGVLITGTRHSADYQSTEAVLGFVTSGGSFQARSPLDNPGLLIG